ncbi:MAG: methyltransferase domain-containing protein [Gammaproteobacteria bacterium]|jgi:SAM-dependent methyltransferase|nr:methyltransferase domain-containing protein [Gammaproteobacteria bacterium]
MSRREHWEGVYSSKPPDRLGWYKPRLQTSLEWIKTLGLEPDAAIIDVGGGACTLIDDLLDEGYTSITVLDIAEPALALLKERLGDKSAAVNWVCGDITKVELPENAFALWHDRAVFHFLIERTDQERYRDNLCRALRPGGRLIIGTFAPEAPPKCSGLPVQRYDLELLRETLGSEFELQRHQEEMHVTPGGVEQMYLYCDFRFAP